MRVVIRVRVGVFVWNRVSVSKTVALLLFVTLRPAAQRTSILGYRFMSRYL